MIVRRFSYAFIALFAVTVVDYLDQYSYANMLANRSAYSVIKRDIEFGCINGVQSVRFVGDSEWVSLKNICL